MKKLYFPLLILSLYSCVEPKYKEGEALTFSEHETVVLKDYTYSDLLLKFLTDTNDYILNEQAVFDRLADSLLYFRDLGQWHFFEQLDSNSNEAVIHVEYTEDEDDGIIYCGIRSGFTLLVNIKDQVLFDGDLLNNSEEVKSLFLSEYLDSNLNAINGTYTRTKSTANLGLVELPISQFQMNLDIGIDARKCVHQFQHWFRAHIELKDFLKQKKSKLLFQQSYHLLNPDEKQLIIQFFPVDLKLSVPYYPPPPLPPVPKSHEIILCSDRHSY